MAPWKHFSCRLYLSAARLTKIAPCFSLFASVFWSCSALSSLGRRKCDVPQDTNKKPLWKLNCCFVYSVVVLFLINRIDQRVESHRHSSGAPRMARNEEWAFFLLFIFPSRQGLFSLCFPQPVLWQADRWAVFTSVPFAGRIAMLCRRCSDIPPQCNHNAPHINFNAAEERSMHHFCSVLSHYGNTWTHINYLSQSAARTRAITRGWGVSEMAKWVPMRRHQHPSVASGLFPFMKVLWTDRDHQQEGESTAGVLAKANRRLLVVVHGSPPLLSHHLNFMSSFTASINLRLALPKAASLAFFFISEKKLQVFCGSKTDPTWQTSNSGLVQILQHHPCDVIGQQTLQPLE